MATSPPPEPCPKVCGLVMPISAIDDCSERHWEEVKEILVDAVDKAGFQANLVSSADDIGIIQKRIIENLHQNPMVVCDVSGKNPNVMFELGIRLAFDKPTVIVKDDKTSYSFDTAPIEHVTYPRDLRFSKIVEFKKTLVEKIKATHAAATKDPNYTTFLKHFGTFQVAKIEVKEVSKEDFMLEEMKSLRSLVEGFVTANPRPAASADPDFAKLYRKYVDPSPRVKGYIDICVRGIGSGADAARTLDSFLGDLGNSIKVEQKGRAHFHMMVAMHKLKSLEDVVMILAEQGLHTRSARQCDKEAKQEALPAVENKS